MTQIHWASAVNGQFGNAALWAGGAAPGAADDALLDAAGPARFIVASGADQTVASVQLAANATLRINAGTFTALSGTGAGANWGTIAVGDGAAFSVGGALDNAGAITVSSFGDQTSLIVASDTTLAGAGAVTLTDNGANRIAAAAGATVTLTNVDNTIAGSGAFDAAGGLSLDNQAFGVIDASGASGRLTIGPTTGLDSLVNDGLIEATGAAGLTIQNETLTGSGGTLFAGYFSSVTLNNCVVNGQTLETAPNGRIYVTGTSSVHLSGMIDNSGSLQFGAGTTQIVDGALTFEGGGDVDFIAATLTAPKTLLTNVDNRIAVVGTLGGPGFGLVNKPGGLIVAASASVVIDAEAKPVQNAGLLEAGFGTALTVTGAVRNAGTLAVEGGAMTIDGAVTGRGVATITGGTLDFAADSNQDAHFFSNFGTPLGTLVLGQSQAYTGSVTGLSRFAPTRLDLRDIGFVSAGEATYVGSGTSGVLTVTDGTHTATIELHGSTYARAAFVAASDGAGGVFVTVGKMRGGQADPHAFVAAMAGLGGAGGMAVHAGHGATAREPMIAAPRMSMA